MIINFNPSVSKNSCSKLAKNNNPAVSFKRNFTEKEIEGVIGRDIDVLNDVLINIEIGLIKAEDGAENTFKNLMEKHPDNFGLSLVKSKLFKKIKTKQ